MKNQKYPMFYLSAGGGHYYDDDGDLVQGCSTAKSFGSPHLAKRFVESHPKLSKIDPTIESREFTEQDLLEFDRLSSLHLRLKRKTQS